MPIQLLDDQVVAQIAAGEVIERPASVVKELVENALDAGAGSVHVAVSNGGRTLIRVSDDGCGIPASDVELAMTRHATSKLRTVDDLNQIRTLGFRGEALASIASVSHLQMVTCATGEAAGTQIRVEGGHLVNQRVVGAPGGTVLTIENLFFNVPARLKFLKSDSTEKRHIASVVMNYALAYPGVRFILEQDGREVIHTNGTGHLADVIVTLMGVDDFKNMVEVGSDERQRSSIRVHGYTSTPDLNRGDRTRILLFVNGRSVQDSKLAYAVIQAYHTFMMNGRYPISVLMLDVPPDEVDVNVHPAKAEVRFQNPNAAFSAVQRTVRRAVVSQASPHAQMRSGGFATGDADDVKSNLGTVEQSEFGWQLQGTGQHARQRDLYTAADPTEIPEGPGAPQKPRTLPLLRVIGQVGASYIVAEGPAGMYLVDQHAAHERVLYEQFVAAYHAQDMITQRTLDAQTIQVSPVDARLIEEHSDLLQSVGFELEPFGPNMFTVRSVPAMLADANPQAVVAAMMSDLETGNQPGKEAIEDRIVRRICKQVAVKAGQVLSHEEMTGLIRQLERCESPHTCPHGRPTILHMSADQLAKEFGRAGFR